MIQPLGRNLIVKVLPKKEEELGSIIIPETANAELAEAEVVSISPDIESMVKVGDIITYPSKKGVGQIIDSTPHLWLSIDDLWGIVS